jgi:hypothetical protein
MIRRTFLCRDTQDIVKSAIFNFTFHLVKELSGVKTSQLISDTWIHYPNHQTPID